MGLAESVNVVITSSTRAVTQQGFGTQLIVGPNANFASRTQVFTDADATLAAALCGGSDSAEYKAAVKAFSQNPAPISIKIGHVRGTKTMTDNAGTYTSGAITGKVNGHAFTAAYDSNKNTTLTALAAAIAAADTTNIASAVYSSGAHTIVVTPNAGCLVAITDLSLSAIGEYDTLEIVLSATAVEDYDDALTAIKAVDDDWYMVSEVSHEQATQELVAAWVEADGSKVYALSTDDTDVADVADASDTTTIAAVLKAAAYARSFGIYSAVADTQYPEAAALGVAAPMSPGRYTMCYKKLAGVTVDTLTPTQSTNVRAKYFNSYEAVGGQNIIRWGKMSDGGYFDFVVFVDWLKARLMEEIFGKLVNMNKISFDSSGFAIIEQAMTSVFKEGQAVDAQGIRAITPYSKDADTEAQNGGYYIEFPKLSDISSTDKTNRALNNVLFKVWYTNGIHTIAVNGSVLL
jgi:hypothetical protein